MPFEGAPILSLFVNEEWVYFVQATPGGEGGFRYSLHRMRHTGEGQEQICDDALHILYVDNETIYYDAYSDYALMRIHTGTKEKEVLISKKGRSIAVSDSYCVAYKNAFPSALRGNDEILFRPV